MQTSLKLQFEVVIHPDFLPTDIHFSLTKKKSTYYLPLALR